METQKEDYTKMLTDLIQKQMVILGPNIALDKARKVPGIVLGEQGQVLEITADPHLVLKGVANEYLTLSGQIAQMTLDILLEKYPNIKKL